MANRRRSIEELEAIDRIVERLREFLRLNHVTTTELARRLGVSEGTLYAWLSGVSRPIRPEHIEAFLDALPATFLGWRDDKKAKEVVLEIRRLEI